MPGREQAAAQIADDLEQLGHDLRAEFNRAVRTIAPVTFSGPVAQLFDRRLRAHLAELDAILATMGLATDDLRIAGRSHGELSLRRPSTGYRKHPGTPGTHTEPAAAPSALPRSTGRCCRWCSAPLPDTTSPPPCCWRSSTERPATRTGAGGALPGVLDGDGQPGRAAGPQHARARPVRGHPGDRSRDAALAAYARQDVRVRQRRTE